MKKLNKVMSPAMFAFLSALSKGTLHGGMKSFQMLDQRTFVSVLKREYVKISNSGHIYLTPYGLDSFQRYTESDVPRRQKMSDLSNLVAQLLHLKQSRSERTPNVKSRSKVIQFAKTT